ncbi:MAG TPA: Tol-Pal system beta propeller repeat protein TolB [Candidatus Megaira endosymbiont of Nemacystus decipiens]|nr:Tol-Pal system beta propeller repeat protein TolB [Candidatus Megaera endosymbiont of Nemacystus decipiens]
MRRIFLSVIICFTLITSVLADNIIDISNGQSDTISIALNDFESNTRSAKQIKNKALNLIKKDLQHSGFFRSLSQSAFIEQKIGTSHVPLFAAWQQINAMLLLNGSVREESDSKMTIQFVLWDSFLEKPLLRQEVKFNKNNWRKAAHEIANIIYKKMTGTPGYFNTQITYISETGDYLKRKKRIAIMDYDGHNHRYLTNGDDLVLTPRFSPDSKRILYLSYQNKIPQVFILDIASGESKLVGNFPGMSFAPRFSPDGKYALMSIAKDGNTHIYEMNLSNLHMKQLTRGNNINTSPSYSPNGNRIVFNSDRNGARQIFVMNRDGSNVKRISYGGGAYAEPTWSKENFVAFTKMSRSIGFSIGIMKPELYQNENNERLIASGYLVESPAWSANNQMIIFTAGTRPTKKSQQKGLNRIYTINLSGYNQRIVPTPHDASDPDWSRAY